MAARTQWPGARHRARRRQLPTPAPRQSRPPGQGAGPLGPDQVAAAQARSSATYWSPFLSGTISTYPRCRGLGFFLQVAGDIALKELAGQRQGAQARPVEREVV